MGGWVGGWVTLIGGEGRCRRGGGRDLGRGREDESLLMNKGQRPALGRPYSLWWVGGWVGGLNELLFFYVDGWVGGWVGGFT